MCWPLFFAGNHVITFTFVQCTLLNAGMKAHTIQISIPKPAWYAVCYTDYTITLYCFSRSISAKPTSIWILRNLHNVWFPGKA